MATQPPRQTRRGRGPTPLTAATLDELALRYVGRFATTRARLRHYLLRKLRERGWEGAAPPPVEALADRLAGMGYVDDAAFALARSRALTGRGYGERRVADALRVAGVGDDDAAEARLHASTEAVRAAVRFAERRRIGPFGGGADDPASRERAIAAMIRAGHGFALARTIIDYRASGAITADALADAILDELP